MESSHLRVLNVVSAGSENDVVKHIASSFMLERSLRVDFYFSQSFKASLDGYSTSEGRILIQAE